MKKIELLQSVKVLALNIQKHLKLFLLRRCQDWQLGMAKVLQELESPNAVDKHIFLQRVYFETKDQIPAKDYTTVQTHKLKLWHKAIYVQRLPLQSIQKLSGLYLLL